MTDAHCHVTGGDPSVREFLIGRDFIGVHPWETLLTVPAASSLRGAVTYAPSEASSAGGAMRAVGSLANASQRDTAGTVLTALRDQILSDPLLGIGEIGLDRLKDKNISPQMREVFEAQLKLAFEFNRPVVLHGAKCWGQVVKAIKNYELRITNETIGDNSQFAIRNSSFLFHGFSRSDGLIPDIVALNGYISVGPAVLNDHAVNYRGLVKKIPIDRLLIETDRTAENAADCPSIVAVATEVAKLRGMPFAELEEITDRNAEAFICYNIRE